MRGHEIIVSYLSNRIKLKIEFKLKVQNMDIKLELAYKGSNPGFIILNHMNMKKMLRLIFLFS